LFLSACRLSRTSLCKAIIYGSSSVLWINRNKRNQDTKYELKSHFVQNDKSRAAFFAVFTVLAGLTAVLPAAIVAMLATFVFMVIVNAITKKGTVEYLLRLLFNKLNCPADNSTGQFSYEKQNAVARSEIWRYRMPPQLNF